MSDFNLSPGITPELVGIVVLEVPLLLALLYGLDRERGVVWAFGLNALGLGLVKLATDYRDPGDLAVAFAGIFGGLLVLYRSIGPAPRPSAPAAFLGSVVATIGGIKVVRDFYDPFDLMLAAVLLVVGGALLVPWLRARAGRPRVVAV
ncbi:MAG: hypothetical protein L3K06_04050 [Thermoplasmata archaeon]|nr:hypothetical protein [Thermoplasmata archaeon]